MCGQRTDCIHSQPLYESARDRDLCFRAGDGSDQVRDRICDGAQECVDEKYRTVAEKVRTLKLLSALTNAAFRL